MKCDASSRVVAEILSDTASMFTHSVDTDGLRVVLSYCLEITGLQQGKIALDDSQQASQCELIDVNSIDTRDPFSQAIADKARISLRPEFAVTNSTDSLCNEYVFPLRLHGISLGVIHLVGSRHSRLNEYSIAVMQGIADIAAVAIFQTHRIQQEHLLASQLQNALESRVTIEQAKGIIAEREKVDFIDAFQHIRSQARREQRPVRSVAADIVSNHRSSIGNNNSPLVTVDNF